MFRNITNELICDIGECKYEEFMAQGFASPGVNGPYNFVDTPVRNTAHWLIIYLYMWKITGDERYKTLSSVFVTYLLTEQSKSTSGAIKCISNSDFDSINGLIGQAWVIEALLYAYGITADEKLLECAKAIFKSQKFDETVSLWKRVDLDGTVIDYDYTLNHQVWFAAAGLMLLNYVDEAGIRDNVFSFLDKYADSYFDIYNDGLIKHYGTLSPPAKYGRSFYVKKAIKNCCLPLRNIEPNRFDSKAQEKGYHLFELYGLAIIGCYYKEYSLFSQREFCKALSYGLDIDSLNKKLHINTVLNGNRVGADHMNKYAYGYNSPAFEYPFICAVFGNGKGDKNDVGAALLQTQIDLTYNMKTHMFENNTYDPNTLTARIYEAIRFLELK